MKSRLALAVAAALCLSGTLTACSESAAPTEAAVPADANPLFVQSSLPYQYPAFDQIKDEHYAPAFERGMAEHLQEVQAIAGNSEAASFENTIVAMERTGQLLGRVSRVFFNLAGANINPAMQKVQAEMAPKLAAHSDAILLNDALYARVTSLYEQRDGLGLDA
jgi:peptidyl-dipeptidase Dcp